MSKSNQQLRAEIARVMRLAQFQDCHDVRQILLQYVAELAKALKPESISGALNCVPVESC